MTVKLRCALPAILVTALALSACGGGDGRSAAALSSQAASDRAAAEAASSAAAETLASAQALASANADAAAASAKAEAAKAAEAKAVAAKAAAAKAAAAKAEAARTAAAQAEETSADFDKAYAIDVTDRIIEQIKSVDERMGDGIQVDGALQLLANQYDRLANAGTPPGADEADYMSRLSTLNDFAQRAADSYADDPTGATAKYEVVRKETKPVLEAINAATGKHFTLPSR